MAEPFIGEVRMFGFTFAPSGWAFCAGQLLPISQNDALFTLIGTTYGGDGVETFALPNLQGRNAIGQGQGGGVLLGELGGAETVTLAANQVQGHAHEVTGKLGRRDSVSPAGASLVPGDMYGSAQPDAFMAAGAVQSVGGAQPHDNMQPFLVLNFCIALQGIFPSAG